MIAALIARCQGRSPQWPAVRAAFLRRHPGYAACGKPAKTAHHIVPVHVEPGLELSPENLVPFCGNRCHLPFGHLFNWRSYNATVAEDSAAILAKTLTRPRCAPAPTVWQRLRSFLRPAACTMIPLIFLCAGCAGPNPTQTRVALFTWYAPKIYVLPAEATNAVGAVFSRDGDTQNVRPSQRGVCIFVDNMIALPNGGGTAASNSVLSGIEIPLVK